MCDLRFEDDGGSIVLIRPLTDAGLDWLGDNVQSEPYQWFGNALGCERRYAADIFNGALGDGLAVQP